MKLRRIISLLISRIAILYFLLKGKVSRSAHVTWTSYPYFSHELWGKCNNKLQVWLRCNSIKIKYQYLLRVIIILWIYSCFHNEYVVQALLLLRSKLNISQSADQGLSVSVCWGEGGWRGVFDARSWGHQLTIFSIFSPESPSTKRTLKGQRWVCHNLNLCT